MSYIKLLFKDPIRDLKGNGKVSAVSTPLKLKPVSTDCIKISLYAVTDPKLELDETDFVVIHFNMLSKQLVWRICVTKNEIQYSEFGR